MNFFWFLNIFLPPKLSKLWLFWVQNENGRGGLDFWATTFFFSKINVTFLDVWMIFIGLFDTSISFQFQNFQKAEFSRYAGLYALSNCTNIQKNFLEKVDYRGRYSSVFKMGTALGKRGVATSILKPHPCHPLRFGTETWWSHPENLSLIAILLLKIFSILRRKTLLKSQISASFGDCSLIT